MAVEFSYRYTDDPDKKEILKRKKVGVGLSVWCERSKIEIRNKKNK